MMDYIFNSMQHILLDWFNKLEHRFEIAEVQENQCQIKLCQIFISQTREGILANLPAGTTWEEAKQILLAWMGEGATEEEACTTLKNLKRGDEDIADLGAKAEKLVRKAYPGQQTAVKRQAIEALLGALDPQLVVEVKKLGHR